MEDRSKHCSNYLFLYPQMAFNNTFCDLAWKIAFSSTKIFFLRSHLKFVNTITFRWKISQRFTALRHGYFWSNCSIFLVKPAEKSSENLPIKIGQPSSNLKDATQAKTWGKLSLELNLLSSSDWAERNDDHTLFAHWSLYLCSTTQRMNFRLVKLCWSPEFTNFRSS